MTIWKLWLPDYQTSIDVSQMHNPQYCDVNGHVIVVNA